MEPNCYFRGCDHKMKTSIANGYQEMVTSIAKRNFPSCSLRSQFTASQKLPLLFPNAKKMESATGTSKWEPSNRKKKLPLLLTSFAIHCLTKVSAFVPQCKTYGISNWNHQIAKRNFPSCSLRSQFTASQKLPLLFPNAKHMESATGTIKSQKETSPLAHFVRNSLPHKSFRFCSPMLNIWNQQLEPANGNHQIAKRNFPSCSLRSQFTASQKLPLLFPNAKHMESATGTSKWEPSNRKKKLPLLLTSFAIHCLTKASAFVPQCEIYGTSKWEPAHETCN